MKDTFSFKGSLRCLFFLLVYQALFFTSFANDTLPVKYKVGLPIVPGFMGLTDNGEVEGFSLELFEALAELDSIQYEWVVGTWAELFEKIKKGEIDLLPGTQVSDERRVYLDFMDENIYSMWSELYISEKSDFDNLNELKGKRIGLVSGDNNGTGFDQYISDFNISYERVYYASHAEVIGALKRNEIFAFAGPSATMMGEMINEVRSTGLFYNPTVANFSFTKGKNKELQEILSDRLSELKKQSGSVYFELYQKYGFSSVPTKETIPTWVKFALVIAVFFIFTVIVFIVLLKKEVSKKTAQLKQRESKLKERAVYLKEAMAVGKMGTWVVLANSQYFFWSKEIYDILEIEQKNRLSLLETLQNIHEDDRKTALDIYRKSLSGKEGFDVEIRMIKPNGTIIYTKQVGVIIRDDNDEPERVLGIMQDITVQKKHELDLLYAKNKAEESERLKSAFLANMSHEIRTPLNAIVGFTELMATTEQSPENRQKYSKIVLDQNTLLLKLINDILDIAKIESGLIRLNIEKSVNVNKVVQNVFDSRINSKNSGIQYKLIENENKDIYISTDKLRLQQILYNFVVNAFKYTNSGSIEIGYDILSQNEVSFFVKDTGVGINDNLKESIFERFQQVDTMQQGAGLGLPISKSLATMLGGTIQLKTKVGVGSEFRLNLPRVYQPIKE